jgi:hypothetical protein
MIDKIQKYFYKKFDEAFYNFTKFNKVNLTRNKNNK